MLMVSFGCSEQPGRSGADGARTPDDAATLSSEVAADDLAPSPSDGAVAWSDGVPAGDATSPASSGVVYREHRWVASGNGLRVGGKLDYGGHDLDLPGEVDLADATKAEVTVEKVLIHDSTRGLSISVNGGAWIKLPEAPKIPAPQWEYQHHIHPTVPVPLAQLKQGKNQFKLKVDPVGWWPQNFVHGVHLRVYYDPRNRSHAEAVINSPGPGQKVGTTVSFAVQPAGSTAPSSIKTVEFLGHYLDVNWEGDNDYHRWHHHFHFGTLTHHVGTASASPFSLTWDTTWLPDQPQPMRFKARITAADGTIYETPEVANVTLSRGYSVELCRPYGVDKMWVTRKGVKGESFDVAGDLAHAKDYQLVWNSWSSSYMNGVSINGAKVMDTPSTSKGYATVFHRETLTKLGPLKKGANKLQTGACCAGKHGMEVQYPGFQVLVRYDKVLSGLNQ